jgi:hypothetical protein
MSKLVLVETVSMFRMRYMIETPDDHPEDAIDAVMIEDAKEFSQKWVGETVVSHRVLTEDEALNLCDVDNEYLKSWTTEQKKTSLFTTLRDQEYGDHPDSYNK